MSKSLRIVGYRIKSLGLLLCLPLGGCDSAERSGAARAGGPCPVPSPEAIDEAPDDGVVVRGTDAACEVVFTPVQELTGGADGTLPRPPVAAAPGGRWLTATYAEGEFAVWSPSGELERRIGLGSGDGPGEFGRVLDLIVDSLAGTVHVLSDSDRMEVYSLDGEYLEGTGLPSPPHIGARLSDGTIATSSSLPTGSPKILLIAGDTAFKRGPAGRMPMPAELRAGDGGVWTAESPWYQFDHHILPSGQVDGSIRREVDWFPERSEEEGLSAPGPLVLGFTIDPERRMVFSRVVQVADPDAPAGSRGPEAPGKGDRPRPPPTREEAEQNNALHFDGVIEVFTFDGDLVASTRFDNQREMPMPVGGGAPGNLWFRLTGVTQSIEILRPELVEKTGR